MATATPTAAVAAAVRYPDWFKAQVVQAIVVHGLSYVKAAQLYDMSEDTIRNWINAANTAAMPVGLDRVDALEHRVARIEHYLALAAAIRDQCRDSPDNGHQLERDNECRVLRGQDWSAAVAVDGASTQS